MKTYLCAWNRGIGSGGDHRDIGEAMRLYFTAGLNSDNSNVGIHAVGQMKMGCGMKLYIGDAGGDAGRDLAAIGQEVGKAVKPGLRLLLSYHYYKEEDLDALLATYFPGVKVDIFADSGAYSAYSVGATVDLDAYITWVSRWKHLLTCASAPDVIGDPVASSRFTERMLDSITGLPVLPVFHVGEPWSYLERWASRVGYMALGGMVPYTRKRSLLGAWLTRAFGIIPKETRVHGFGMTTWSLLLGYPWYSVDSSSWTAGFRYGSLMLFDEQRGRFITISMSTKGDLLANARLMESYGIRPPQMTSRGFDRNLLCGVSIRAWQRAEAWLTARMGMGGCYLCCGDSHYGADSSPTNIGRSLVKEKR